MCVSEPDSQGLLKLQERLPTAKDTVKEAGWRVAGRQRLTVFVSGSSQRGPECSSLSGQEVGAWGWGGGDLRSWIHVCGKGLSQLI